MPRQLSLVLALFIGVLAASVARAASPGAGSVVQDIGGGLAFIQRPIAQRAEASSPRSVTFGLSPDQIAALKALSRGRIDFGGYERVAVAPGTSAKSLRGFRGHAGDRTPPFAGAGLASTARPQRDRVPDPALASEWWVNELNAPAAWSIASGKGVTIADCDAGFYTEEPDLLPNLRLDLRRDLSDGNDPGNVSDGRFTFHGTAVAAIMTGVRDGRGTNGLAFDAKLVPLQYFNFDDTLDDLDKEEGTARCVLHALALTSVDVIVVQNQTSRGSSETFAGTRDAIRLALSSGVAVVSAAGNAGVELVDESVNDSGSIIVGALRRDGRAAIFSNYGKRVTISAFGESLRTLYGPNGRLDAFGGTTGAAAQVGATIALMREVNPELTPAQLRRVLFQTRIVTPGNTNVGGRLDVEAAVRRAQATEPDEFNRLRQRSFRDGVQRILMPSGEKGLLP